MQTHLSFWSYWKRKKPYHKKTDRHERDRKINLVDPKTATYSNSNNLLTKIVKENADSFADFSFKAYINQSFKYFCEVCVLINF